MDTAVIVAFACVTPIQHEYAAVRAITQFHAAKPGIARHKKIGTVFADITASVAFENFVIGAAAMQIQRKEATAILRGPVIALVNHHADMRMATTDIVRRPVPRFLPADGGIEMPMVRMLIDQGVR